MALPQAHVLSLIRRSLNELRLGHRKSTQADVNIVKKHYQQLAQLSGKEIEPDENAFNENPLRKYFMDEVRKYQHLDLTDPSNIVIQKQKCRTMEAFLQLQESIHEYEYLLHDMKVGIEKDEGPEHIKTIAKRVGLSLPDKN